MQKELSDLLYQRWPAIFAEHIRPQEDAASWKIWCRDGWFQLIDTLCEQLQGWTNTHHAPQYVATDVKEKFGELRFVSQHKSAEQIGAVKMAYAMSTKICEECGASGHHVVAGGTWMTRCETHMPAGAIPVEEFKRLLAARQSDVGDLDQEEKS